VEDFIASHNPDENKPSVAVVIPAATREKILSAESLNALTEFALVRLPKGSQITLDELPQLLNGAVACITGWGTPPLSVELLNANPNLRLIAHAAGSIRNLVPLNLVDEGLRVSHAAAIIADAVAEFVISEALLGLRPLHEIDRGMRAGEEWKALRERYTGRLLGACTVGIIGAGYVGRKVIHLFNSFGAKVGVYDPLLTNESAAALGVLPCTLDQLLAESDVVSLHTPVLPETREMIGAAQLAQMRDGSLFINTARAALVDEEALLKELQSGRINAALDVFATEPLPFDSPFRSLPNVILSPHAAGHTTDTYLRQGRAMVEDVGRYIRGEPLVFEVSVEMLPTMA
jgi:phosphoglycerate dehydrogenase-like enzyme